MPQRLLTLCEVHIDGMHYAKLPSDAERIVSAVKRTVVDHLSPWPRGLSAVVGSRKPSHRSPPITLESNRNVRTAPGSLNKFDPVHSSLDRFVAVSPELEGVTGHFFLRERERRTKPITYDREVARRLWELSEPLCRVADSRQMGPIFLGLGNLSREAASPLTFAEGLPGWRGPEPNGVENPR
jgi:hypothetical protein